MSEQYLYYIAEIKPFISQNGAANGKTNCLFKNRTVKCKGMKLTILSAGVNVFRKISK